VRAEGDATATVNADKGFARVVKINGVYRTHLGTVSTTNAKLLLYQNAPALPL
jgi:hypothetical protein